MTSQNYATVLPVEIWRECFMLLGVTEHKKLAKTCRFFHDVCLAFIFKSITLSSQIAFYKYSAPQEITRQLEKLTNDIGLFTKLAMSPQYAPHVRKCTLRYSLRLSTSTVKDVAKLAKDAYESFIQAFVKCIPRLVNVQEIAIGCMKKMDKRVLAVLATLPHVEKLSLTSVRFGVHQLKSQIKVKKLWIRNSMSDANPNKAAKRLELFSAEHLQELSVSSRAYAPKIFLALTNQGPLKNLVCLAFDLNSTNLDVLYPFLAMCPNIESIRVDFGSYNEVKHIAFPSLPRSTIPLLRSFSGQDSIAKIFLPGRPVKKVSLVQFRRHNDRDCSEMKDMMPYFLRSTGPVIDLAVASLMCTPELMALLAAHLPDLTRLKLGLSCLKVFPAENPHRHQLEQVKATELVAHDPGSVASHSSDVMLPVYAHAVYMTLLHWTAHKRIVLPRSLETLHLVDEFSFMSFQLESDLDDDSTDRNTQEGSYTFAMAESIFDAVSLQYPALQRLIVGSVEDGMEWYKSAMGKWELLTNRQYGRYFI
ncbi:hypothetical protein GALMADRAFT_145699 [Galerina marginata CBS 339.88]|uniref:F-box domain-containing protein n=1 Tax=Galerina marginata (strain CBS 339.88) TaxID=685588 RepID=A0A067SR97_GALM3|nr:hypothetical protein GALMADRAFT_145699 [Galerina marginata CBS 339.88]